MIRALAFLAAALAAFPAAADDDDDDKGFGLAGIMSKSNRETLPSLTLSAGMPIAEGPLKLKSGKYYIIEIEADGSQELALAGADFFRAVWVNEIVIEGIEIRPLGVDSIEFDEAGEAEISFVAIKPGTYSIHVPGSTGETQRVEVVIE